MEGFFKSSAAGRWRETGSSSGTGLAQRVMLGRRGDACSDDRSPAPSRSVVLPISTRSIQCFGRAGYSLCGVLLVASSAVLALGYSEHGPITSDPTISGRPEPKVTDGARANLSAKIRVQSTLVLIPVTVVDPQYHFVAGLKRDDFRLFEDQVEQNIVQCSIEDAPVSVGLIVDRSGSMRGKMDQIGRASCR